MKKKRSNTLIDRDDRLADNAGPLKRRKSARTECLASPLDLIDRASCGKLISFPEASASGSRFSLTDWGPLIFRGLHRECLPLKNPTSHVRNGVDEIGAISFAWASLYESAG